MATVRDVLAALPDDAARSRVLRWASDAVGVASPVGQSESSRNGGGWPASGAFASLAELLDGAQPESRAQRILTVAYWIETSTGAVEFAAQAINDELKNLGEGVPNITVALSALISKKPALVRQTRKSGRTQQARKRYALTSAGRAVVTGLLARASG